MGFFCPIKVVQLLNSATSFFYNTHVHAKKKKTKTNYKS